MPSGGNRDAAPACRSRPRRRRKREGLEPTFRHLDDPDVPWQAVKAQRNADGSVAHVWEKWLAFSPDPQYLTIYARYDPGMVVRRHGHFSPHVVFVLEGEVTFGERRCPAGTHIELPLGAAFGPVVAGPEGAVMFEVMMGDPRSWGDDPEAFEAALAAQGAEALPDPPLEFPAWLADLRAHWAGGAADGRRLRSARRGAGLVADQAALPIMKGTRRDDEPAGGGVVQAGEGGIHRC